MAFRWCDGNVKPNAEHLACESVVNDAGSSHTIAGHASLRLPLWLKIGWTIWLIVWVPLYWRQFGLQNFLFFCDMGNVLIGIGLWMESPLIFSWAASGLLLFQTIYTVDLAGAVLTGHHIVGGTEYMFDPGLPLFYSPAQLVSRGHAAPAFVGDLASGL